MRRFVSILTVFVLSIFALPCLAQYTSTIQGTVLDPSGAVVSGATVTLTSEATQAQITFTTTKSGDYFFNRIAPGTYTVEVTAPGFQTYSQAVTVTTDATSGVNVHLSVGSASNKVTVTAINSHALNPEETRLQYTLSAKEIQQFPLQNRATLGLLAATPGATGVDEGHLNVSVNRDSSSVAVNGRTGFSNLYLLDNIPMNSELGGPGTASSLGFATMIPTPDMISEVALQATTYSVQYGASTGIQASMTTKSGSNKFHGDADYTYTGAPLAAFSNTQTTSLPYREQFISGALGGPIWKDHTFFFGSYFNQQDEKNNSVFSAFYAPDFVNWGLTNYPNSENFSKGLAPFPATRAVPGTTQVLHTAKDADGNCGAPETGMPIGIPCALPVWDQAIAIIPSENNGTEYNLRLDQVLRGGKDRAYLSFFRFDQKSLSYDIKPSFDGVTPSTGYYLAGNYTHTFTPNLLNQASFGLTRFDFAFTDTPHSTAQLTVPYLYGDPGLGGLYTIKFLEHLREHQAYGVDSLSWVHGRHNMSFGFQGGYNNATQDDSQVYGRPFLQFAFSVPDFVNDVSDLELIYTLSANTNNFPGKFIPQFFGAQNVRFGAYAQDAWKITPHLLITYGIRWDDFGNPTNYGLNSEAYSNVHPGTGSTLQEQVAGLSVGLVKAPYANRQNHNFLPRASFAYQLPEDENTVVRGGIGLYQDDLNLTDVTAAIPTQPPVRLSLTLTQGTTPKALNSFGDSTVQGPPGGNPYGFQFPVYPIYGYNSKGAPIDQNGNVQIGDLYGIDPHLKPQSSMIYSLGVEHSFPKNMVAGLNYSGSHSYNQLVLSDVNTYPGLYADLADQDQVGVRTNPDFGKIKYYRNVGIGNYNAIIATLRQTVGALTYQASYTYGKSMADPFANLTDQLNIHSQYTYAMNDIRNRFTLTQVYQMPQTLISNKWLNEAVGGIQISNTLIAQSGSPFTVATTSGTYDFNRDGNAYDIPLYLGTKRSFSTSDARKSFFGKQSAVPNVQNLFVVPPGLSEGGLQYGFRGPGYFTLNTGLSKSFVLPWFSAQKATLAVRAEAINTLNRANYQNPDGTYDDGSQMLRFQSVNQGRIIQLGGRFQF